MGKIYAYLRVSSQIQHLSNQKFEIENYARREGITIDEWVQEKISSRKPLCKRELWKLLEKLDNGDILIATEISRLGRSMLEVMRILEMCLNKNCQVWTLKEHYRLGNDIQSKVMAFAFGISAEIERELISQRTKASLENVKASGKKLGRPFSAESKKLKLSRYAKKVRELLDLGLTQYKIAKILGVHQITIKRFVERMGWA